MAARSRRKRDRPSYDVLHNISTVDYIYDDKPKKTTKRNVTGTFEVDRVIADRNASEGKQYLLKWKNYSAFQNSWEPGHHLTPALLSYYLKPRPSIEVVQEIVDRLRRCIMESLRAKAICQTVTVEFRHDVFTFLFAGKGHQSGKWTMLYRHDFTKAEQYLFHGWDCLYNQHGDGYKIKYPVKIRWFLSPSPKQFVEQNGILSKAPTSYTEKLTLSYIKDPCCCMP